MKTNTILKTVILCAICAATMMSGCIDPATEENCTTITPTATPGSTMEPTPEPTPQLSSIEILVDELVMNVEGSAASPAMTACEMAQFIESNYDYDVGVAILSTKQSYYYIAQTWVIIGGTRFIIDPETGYYWIEVDHGTEFGHAYKIEFVPVKKGIELVKACTDYWNSCEHTNATPTHTPTPTPTHTTGYISSVPDDYYNVEVDKYFVSQKIYNYLDGYTWNKPLIRGAGWGLPEVAELEHDLTERGCNVTIRYASVATTIDHEDFKNRVKTDGYARSACLPEIDQYDTWLMIEFEGEMVAYDVYGSYWVFKPDHKSKNYYISDGRWHSWYYYQEGTTEIYDGDTWTVYDFKDFKDIYEIEEWFLSGDARTWEIEHCKNGVWCSYCTSDDYDPVDDFLIHFGWWMTEDEYHATETRINTATDWFVLVE